MKVTKELYGGNFKVNSLTCNVIALYINSVLVAFLLFVYLFKWRIRKVYRLKTNLVLVHYMKIGKISNWCLRPLYGSYVNARHTYV